MKKTLKRFFNFSAIALLCISLAPTLHAQDSGQKPPVGTKVLFNNFPRDASEALVTGVWKTHPDYKPIWEKFQLFPDHAIGLADLNGDGNPEIFARHTEINWGFCDKQGFACRTHVYAYTAEGLVEIGDFQSADPIVILADRNRGVNSLSIAGSDDTRRVYKWDGKVYALSK